MAVPRGGIVVGYEVAKELNAPLDLTIPRKIGAPDQPELAIGAVAQDGTVVLDNRLVEYLGVSKTYIREEVNRQIGEIRRRMEKSRGDEPYPPLEGRDVIFVDDGIATGSTIRAAILSARKQNPASITVAIPVGPLHTIEELRREVDHVVCLQTPEPFYAIGQFYQDFTQTTDEEVIRLLREQRSRLKDKPQ